MTQSENLAFLDLTLECAVCGHATAGLFKKSKTTREVPTNSENESILKLLGYRDIFIQPRLCPECFHGAIFPKFDTAVLYGDRGVEARLQAAARYQISGAAIDGRLSYNYSFLKLSRELGRLKSICQFIASSLPASVGSEGGIRLLDWGGGDGYISSILSKGLSAVTGRPVESYIYDYTEWGDLKSKKVGLRDLNRLARFDVVILSHVLEHTHDPVKTLKMAVSFLVKGGIVFCEVPDARFNTVRALAGFMGRLEYHVCWFSRNSLRQCLEKAGVSNISMGCHYVTSYRGEGMSSLVGVGVMGVGTAGNEVGVTTRIQRVLEELISFLALIPGKIALKLSNLPRKSYNK